MDRCFNLQGHRGARGLRPENTLPSFESALDVGVSSIETDLHLTGDGVVVLCHDPILSPRVVSPLPGSPPLTGRLLVAGLSLERLRGYRAAGNPDPLRFPQQQADVPLLAADYAARHGIDPHAIPTLADLFRFVADYAGEAGARAGKTQQQRRQASRLIFDLELKRVPFFPEAINDSFTGQAPGLLEQRIVEAVRSAGVVERTVVRSFDHRCVRWLRQLEPGLTGAVLIAEIAPIDPAELVRQAEAQIYCPAYQFLDRDLVQRVQAAGYQVLPWTVNDSEHWDRLLEWGVDGITTDFPDRLGGRLRVGIG